MATVDTTPKVAYVFNQQGDTWHPVAGAASPDISYNWTNTHNFNAAVQMANTLISAMGINNFANETDRNNALGPVTGKTPTAGTISFIRSTSRLEFWNGSTWTQLGSTNNDLNTLVRRDGQGNFSAGTITANLTGTASQATVASQAAQLTTNVTRRINGKQFNGNDSNFILTPVTYLSSGTTVGPYKRIFVRQSTSTPGTGAIDGTAPAIGDIYIGWA
jgi:hypothetical protein